MNNIKPPRLSLEEVWKRVIKLGYDANASHIKKSTTMMLNGVVTLTGILTVFLALALNATGYQRYYHFYMVPVVLAVLLFNHHKKYDAARLFYILGTFFVLIDWCFEDSGIGNEYMLVVLATTSSFLFIKKYLIYLLNILSAAVFLSYKFLTLGVQGDYTVLPWLVFLASVGIVSFQIAFFRNVAEYYKSQLNLRYAELNDSLRAQKITEAALSQSNEALKQTNRRLESTTEQLKIIVRQKNSELETYVAAIDMNMYSAITDLTGKFLHVNDPLLKVSGYARTELIGQSSDIMSMGDESKKVKEESSKATLAGKTWRGELECRRKDGSSFLSDCVMIPIKDENNQVKCLLSLGIPIKGIKENKLIKEKTLAVLETIAFETSHAVRGPLARIKGLSHLVKADLVSEGELKMIAEKFCICTDELSTATTDLVNFVSTHREWFEGQSG